MNYNLVGSVFQSMQMTLEPILVTTLHTSPVHHLNQQ